MPRTKTHEVCANCNRWLALEKPHVSAKVGDRVVYLHIKPCFRDFADEHALTDIVVLGYNDAAAYGGGS